MLRSSHTKTIQTSIARETSTNKKLRSLSEQRLAIQLIMRSTVEVVARSRRKIRKARTNRAVGRSDVRRYRMRRDGESAASLGTVTAQGLKCPREGTG